MLNPIRWWKNQRSWWKDRKDSPVYQSELKDIRDSVQKAMERPEDSQWRPRLEGQLPSADSDTPILLACCDEGYFYKFGRQLAISSIIADPDTRIHLHIYDPSPLCTADAEFLQVKLGPRLTVSTEGPERNPYQVPTAYFYAAGRFAVAADVLNHCKSPVMVIDVDGVVRRKMAPEFAKLASCDIGLIMRPEKRKPWRRILACAVFLNPTENGMRFIRDLGEALSLALQSCPAHHVDQTVLHELVHAYRHRGTPLKIAPLDLTWGDHDFSEDSTIWSAKGGRKRQFHGVSLEQARKIMSGA
jgi:hypothetical protein